MKHHINYVNHPPINSITPVEDGSVVVGRTDGSTESIDLSGSSGSSGGVGDELVLSASLVVEEGYESGFFPWVEVSSTGESFSLITDEMDGDKKKIEVVEASLTYVEFRVDWPDNGTDGRSRHMVCQFEPYSAVLGVYRNAIPKPIDDIAFHTGSFIRNFPAETRITPIAMHGETAMTLAVDAHFRVTRLA